MRRTIQHRCTFQQPWPPAPPFSLTLEALGALVLCDPGGAHKLVGIAVGGPVHALQGRGQPDRGSMSPRGERREWVLTCWLVAGGWLAG